MKNVQISYLLLKCAFLQQVNFQGKFILVFFQMAADIDQLTELKERVSASTARGRKRFEVLSSQNFYFITVYGSVVV